MSFSDRTMRLALTLALLLPAACAAPRPANPFAGAWATSDRQQIAFRDDTIVLSPPGMPPTPMSAQTCGGQFHLGYATWSRAALIDLAVRQPELQQRLERQLVGQDYPIASVLCGEGGTTYVLVDANDVLAIHRDREIAGLEHLSRP